MLLHHEVDNICSFLNEEETDAVNKEDQIVETKVNEAAKGGDVKVYVYVVEAVKKGIVLQIKGFLVLYDVRIESSCCVDAFEETIQSNKKTIEAATVETL